MILTNFFETYKKPLLIGFTVIFMLIIALLTAYNVGINTGYQKGYKEGFNDASKNIIKSSSDTTPAKVQAATQTIIKYVPKETDATGKTEAADIDAEIGKQSLTVRVNGQEQNIKKSDSEKYIFDKNKLKIDQKSTAQLDLHIPVVDNTRRWSIGAGYSNHGLAAKIDFPIAKSDRFGGWIAGDQKTAMAGISIKF